MTKPEIGDVWRYPYLWKWQFDNGETEGRKPRPTLLSAVVPVGNKSTFLYLLPITGTEPTSDRDFLELPATEIRRAGLSAYKQLWIIVDEYNRDTLETSFYFEPTGRAGAFSRAFIKQVVARFAAAVRAQRAAAISRTE